MSNTKTQKKEHKKDSWSKLAIEPWDFELRAQILSQRSFIFFIASPKLIELQSSAWTQKEAFFKALTESLFILLLLQSKLVFFDAWREVLLFISRVVPAALHVQNFKSLIKCDTW